MKKRKIKYKKVFIFIIILLMVCFTVYKIINTSITSVYIINNKYLSKDEILRILKLDENTKLINTILLENRLNDNEYILNCKITHKNIFDIYIEVEENIPLYYNKMNNKSVLLSGEQVDRKFIVPVLMNEIPKDKIEKFNKEIKKVDIKTLNKISEINYTPTDKDKNLFLLSMTDGNYVYLTLDRFDNINTYLDIMNKLEPKINGKKGILYLDSGNYFDIL